MKIKLIGFKKISANKIYAGIHWAKRKKIKDEYLRTFKKNLLKYKVKKCKNPVNLSFIFEFKNRPLDCSNCFFMAKMLEDCLVHTEIIKDDNTQYVHSFYIKSMKSKNKENTCTINIEEIDE